MGGLFSSRPMSFYDKVEAHIKEKGYTNDQLKAYETEQDYDIRITFGGYDFYVWSFKTYCYPDDPLIAWYESRNPGRPDLRLPRPQALPPPSKEVKREYQTLRDFESEHDDEVCCTCCTSDEAKPKKKEFDAVDAFLAELENTDPNFGNNLMPARRPKAAKPSKPTKPDRAECGISSAFYDVLSLFDCVTPICWARAFG